MMWDVTAYAVIGKDRYNRPKFKRAMVKTPALAAGEIAVKVRLKIDSKLFDTYIPEVVAEIKEGDIMLPEVEVIENFESTS